MADLDAIARSVIALDGIESAAIFVVRPGADGLELGAAAGIEGPARDGLVAAVANPAHPIRRALSDDGPTFDVAPMNPGGPRLRSHLPLFVERAGPREAVGVLAVAHDANLGAGARIALEALADAAAVSIADDPRS
jgi:hypothetical protein